MKRSILIFLTLILLVCTACNKTESDKVSEETIEQTSVPSVEIKPKDTLPATAMPTDDAIIEPVSIKPPEVIQSESDVYIPDIMLDTNEKEYSFSSIFEDNEYIYLNIGKIGALTRVNKESGNVKVVCEGCEAFSVNDRTLFYSKRNDDDTWDIVKYDLGTNTNKVIIHREAMIWGIASAGEKLFFLCEAGFHSDERSNILYVCDLNGDTLVKIGDAVDRFYIYDDKIFGSFLAEDESLIEYFENGEQKKINDRTVLENFSISYGKIICSELVGEGRFTKNFMYDIYTDCVTELPAVNLFFTAIGQYMVFFDMSEKETLPILKAYDFLENVEYTLQDVTDIVDKDSVCSVATTKENVYVFLSICGQREIYRVKIKDGEASLEYVATIFK